MNVLPELQKWYASNCDGEWEHAFGIEIGTLDNPGWAVTIDLEETNLEGKEFRRVEDNTSAQSWIVCWVEGEKFHGAGDPGKLERILQTFIDWAKSQNGDWLKPPAPMTDEERRMYEDKRLFASLDSKIEGEGCRHEGCERSRIQYSVMCREHHFEMVTRRAVPKGDG
jgi:hypothetical protein